MKKQTWSDQFIRHMIAKGSITPPTNSDRYMPGWYWPVIGLILAGLVVLAFFYGAYYR